MPSLAMLAEESTLLDQALLYGIPLFGSVMLAYALFNLIHDLRKPGSKRVVQRLREGDGTLSGGFNERIAKESILQRQRLEGGGLSALLSKFAFMPAFQTMLDQANLPWSAVAFLINLLGLASLGYIACYFLGAAQWIAIAVAVGVLLLPIAAVQVKRKFRLNRFVNQLPDVFELMGQGLRAGHSLANAIMLVSQQLPDPVGTEFARIFYEQNLGIKIEDALKNMARRVGLLDVRFFVTAVLIQRQTGGDLAEVLDNISGVIRDRIKLFGLVKALTAEGRLSGWVLLALPMVVFVMELVVNPKYANVLLDEPLGQYMLMGAGVAQILGLLMIQKIVNIKV
jgi:tight adherence protein B